MTYTRSCGNCDHLRVCVFMVCLVYLDMQLNVYFILLLRTDTLSMYLRLCVFALTCLVYVTVKGVFQYKIFREKILVIPSDLGRAGGLI